MVVTVISVIVNGYSIMQVSPCCFFFFIYVIMIKGTILNCKRKKNMQQFTNVPDVPTVLTIRVMYNRVNNRYAFI